MQETIATSSSNLGSLFQQNVKQVLGREMTISPFEDVARVIKEEINNVKRINNTGSTSLILKIQPCFQLEQRHQSAPSRAIYQHPNTSSLTSNPSIFQQYGSKCAYCQKDGHWYIDCTQYEKDYKEKGLQLRRLPCKYQYPESRFKPMNPRTAVQSIQADINDEAPNIINARHISEVDDGQILIDSGASAHPFFCKQCAKSKGALRCPDLGKSIIKYDKVLDLVVSDVVGPITAEDTTMRYFVTLRDHKSTFVLSRPMVSRSDVVLTLKQWLEFFKTNKGSYPKFLQTDNAKEYVPTALTNFCSERGIKEVPVIAYTPTNNDEAERLHRTIGEASRTMLHSSSLPEKFWPYAYQVATYLHNRLPNKRTKDSTLLEEMFNVQPSASTLYQFGTKAIIQIPAPTAPELAPRAFNAILIGYPTSGRGWIFYVPSSCSTVHSAHLVFPETHEAKLINSRYSNKMKIDNLLNSISMKLGQVPTNKIIDQQQSTIENTKMVPDMTLPNNIKDALTSRESTEWLLAANNELKQFDKLNVWTAIDAQPKIKVLVKGFSQRPGQDFGDFYAPTASLVTLRLILALKVQHNLHMTTFDVSGAYLHSPIEEEIYVKARTEIRPELKGKVMKLNKVLYGTSQATRCWWLFFKSIMSGIGLDEIEIEASLTRLDMAHAVSFLARYSHNPTLQCWELLDHIIGYLMGTINKQLWIEPNETNSLDLWTDANWGGSYERSTSGGLILYAGCPIQWMSKRQRIVAMSTCTAEYVAMGDSAQHLSHLINLVCGLDITPKPVIHCDNEAAILITNDNTSRKRTKYLTRALFFVNDLIRQEKIQLKWVTTKEQLADILTKSLSPVTHNKFMERLNL
ncbi:hypothetical protein O181_002311 [Austropuccinia psidii MF-1]|uniref:Integrase catalytic domain-containing protein n=1 Tax=Austropuccinia psidii MF-1 TaxID=1389203 RepID=A0A9Q3GD65_9BASI|nr:hypothetical protein [Austropuccinia psidii MF-1]